MKPSILRHLAFCVGTSVLLAGAATYSDPAHAARDKEHSTKGKTENAFPHTKRVEPKLALSQSAQRKLNKASDLLQEDKLDEAKTLLDEVLGDAKLSAYGKALAMQLLSQVSWQREDYAGATSQLKQAIALDALPNANQFPAMYQLAQLYLMDEKYQDALAAVDDYMKQSGNTPAEALALKGNALYRLEKYQDAIDAMKEALAKADKPNDSWRQIMMASFFELNQFDEAAKIAEADLAKDPNNKKLIQQLGTIYLNAKQEQKALQLMADAKAKGLFTTQDDYKQLAQLYNFAEKSKDAAQVLEEGFQKGVIQPSFEMYKLLGDSYSLAEDEAKAIEAYAKASPLAKDGEADFLRGQLLVNAQRWQEARDALSKAIQRGVKRMGAAYVLRGNAENELGDKQAAIADMEKARGYDETRKMAETWLRSIKTGGVPQKKK